MGEICTNLFRIQYARGTSASGGKAPIKSGLFCWIKYYITAKKEIFCDQRQKLLDIKEKSLYYYPTFVKKLYNRLEN